jgi:dihydroorotase
VKAVKWYPAGATTNSGAGVKETDLDRVLPVLQAMAEVYVCVCVCARARACV